MIYNYNLQIKIGHLNKSKADYTCSATGITDEEAKAYNAARAYMQVIGAQMGLVDGSAATILDMLAMQAGSRTAFKGQATVNNFIVEVNFKVSRSLRAKSAAEGV